MKLHLTKKKYERAFALEGVLLLLLLLLSALLVELLPGWHERAMSLCSLAMGTMFLDLSLYDYIGEEYGYHKSTLARWYCVIFGAVMIVEILWLTITYCGPLRLDAFGLMLLGKLMSSVIFAGELLKGLYEDREGYSDFCEQAGTLDETLALSFQEYVRSRQ